MNCLLVKKKASSQEERTSHKEDLLTGDPGDIISREIVRLNQVIQEKNMTIDKLKEEKKAANA